MRAVKTPYKIINPEDTNCKVYRNGGNSSKFDVA
jgi:hypothetical protein